MSATDRFGSAAPGTLTVVPLPEAEDEERKRRRWPWVLLALVLVGAATYGGTRWAVDRHEVDAWQVVEDLPPGTPIDDEDVVLVRVDADDQVSGLLDRVPRGSVARVFVPAGSLVTESVITQQDLVTPGKGRSLVGLSLTAAQTPTDNVSPGDLVDILATPQLGSDETVPWPGRTVARNVEVWSVGAGQEGTTAMTVAVPSGRVGLLSSHAALGQLTVVRVGTKG